MVGFRDQEEIFELIEENEVEMGKSLISKDIWKKAGSPEKWMPWGNYLLGS